MVEVRLGVVAKFRNNDANRAASKQKTAKITHRQLALIRKPTVSVSYNATGRDAAEECGDEERCGHEDECGA